MDNLRKILDKLKERPLFATLDIWAYKIISLKLTLQAGALAYFLVLSVFPFLMALLTILPRTPLGDMSVLTNLTEPLPDQVTTILQSFMRGLEISSTTILPITLLAGLWSASLAIRQIVKTINMAYTLQENRNPISTIILSLGLTLGLIILIIVLLISQIFGDQLLKLIQRLFKLPVTILPTASILQDLLALIAMFIVFYSLYRLAPQRQYWKKIPATSLLPGALFATLALVLANTAFKFYVNNFSSYAVTYGSLAGIIIFLIWLYLLGLIILLGGSLSASCLLIKTKYKEENWPRKESLVKSILGTHESKKMD